MLLDNDITIQDRFNHQSRLFQDLEAAVRFAISQIFPMYRFGTVTITLSMNICGRPGFRVTPIFKVFVGYPDHSKAESVEPELVKLDLRDIYDQVSQRLVSEKLKWEDVQIDVKKEHMYDKKFVALPCY